MTKSSINYGKVSFEKQLSHRIDVGRAAVNGQRSLFKRQFGRVESEWKEDQSRVTASDRAISDNLAMALRRHFSEDVYCCEEANPEGKTLNLESGFSWVVDPVDGTDNYALGFPLCAISLALLHEGTPVYGFIYDFSTDSLLEGGPEFDLLKDQEKVDSVRDDAGKQPLLGLHFPMEAKLLGQLKPLLSKYRVRCNGSSALTAALLATGYLDGVVDPRVKVWDIAAGYALCAGVGIEFKFLGENVFPLQQFHPLMDGCPYFAGTDALCAELSKYLV